MGTQYNKKPLEWIITKTKCFEIISHKPQKSSNYIYLRINGKKTPAHRYIYSTLFGEIPKGLCVCHKCDNRKCINPEHLFLGTHQDNMRDMVNKDRQAKGEKHGSSKLTRDQVLLIKKDNRLQVEIAKDYNVHPSTIGLIKRGVNWAQIF